MLDFFFNLFWKKKIAVLVGDYLLSKGLLAAVENDAYDILKITSRAVKEISEGELLQIEKSRKLDITEDVYFEIIRRKTASLIAACCACGAASAGARGSHRAATTQGLFAAAHRARPTPMPPQHT